jgi:8-oxo-dGTP pyrophosphatase MutT (NUDIX family)
MKLRLEDIALTDPGPHQEADGKHAAVAAVLREREPGAPLDVLLIRRAETPGDPWSGHMAFPGGRRQEGDPSLLHTAIRETREEVGLEVQMPLGRLPDVPAIAKGRPVGLTITPFVFAVRGDPPAVPLEREVAEIVWTPLETLAVGMKDPEVLRYPHEGVIYKLPCVRLGERVVWGLTYRMLELFFEALSSARARSPG